MKRLLLIVGLVLAGCSQEVPRELVVYAPEEMAAGIAEKFSRSPFNIVVHSDGGEAVVDLIISKSDSPRADLVMVDRIADIWRAADQGALRPAPEGLYDEVADSLKDADGAWFAYDFRQIEIRTTTDRENQVVSSYADLAKPEFAGRLCMTQSSLADNQALVAMLIADLGVKPAERMVRNWVRNLALPPFADPEEVGDALRAGHCDYAIGTTGKASPEINTIHPEPRYFAVFAIGVARHANHPEAAWEAVRWLVDRTTKYDPEKMQESAIPHVSMAGWHAEDARLLAERAGYR